MTLKIKIEKYFYISYYTFKKSAIYWTNNLMGVISSIIFICIASSIWTAVYKNSNSFIYLKLNETLSYVVVITIINQIVSRNTELVLGNRVMTGNISVDLIRPINYFKYLFFCMIGDTLFNFVFSIIPLIFTAIFFFKITIISISNLSAFMLSILFSFILTYIFEFVVGLISFLTSQIFGVSLLKSSLVNVLAGLTVPITFYPEVLQKIFLHLPFQAIYYIPLSLYLDMPYNPNLIQKTLETIGMNGYIINRLTEQVIWIIIFSIIAIIGWKISIKKLVIQGG